MKISRVRRLFRTSLLAATERVPTPFVTRRDMYLTMNSKPVILRGDHKSGKTAFVSDMIRSHWYPWWSQWLFRPYGFFITGNQSQPSVDAFFTSVFTSEKNKTSFSEFSDFVNNRHTQQRIRRMIQHWFPNAPSVLKPQPTLAIIDQSEELIAMYRAAFVTQVEHLVKFGRDFPTHLQLMFVVNTEAAVDSLLALNGGDLFRVVEYQNPAADDVRAAFGASVAIDKIQRGTSQTIFVPIDEFVEVFTGVDNNIGLAFSYYNDTFANESPAEYKARKEASYTDKRKVINAVTKAEIAIHKDSMAQTSLLPWQLLQQQQKQQQQKQKNNGK